MIYQDDNAKAKDYRKATVILKVFQIYACNLKVIILCEIKNQTHFFIFHKKLNKVLFLLLVRL